MSEGLYLPKEADAKKIGEFRPISILNVDGKVFFGILAWRVISFVQKNGYVDESVQKAGIPGIPGCVCNLGRHSKGKEGQGGRADRAPDARTYTSAHS